MIEETGVVRKVLELLKEGELRRVQVEASEVVEHWRYSRDDFLRLYEFQARRCLDKNLCIAGVTPVHRYDVATQPMHWLPILLAPSRTIGCYY